MVASVEPPMQLFVFWACKVALPMGAYQTGEGGSKADVCEPDRDCTTVSREAAVFPGVDDVVYVALQASSRSLVVAEEGDS